MSKTNDTTYSVYRIVCFATGKCYVGQTVDKKRRRKQHFSDLVKGVHHSAKLQKAFNLYGIAQFYFEIVESDIPQSSINEREIFWISHFDSFHNGYNHTPGGQDHSFQGEPCEWNGMMYPSIASAARALGVPFMTMVRRVKSGHTSTATLSPNGQKQCKWNGITYPSRRAAARDNNLTPELFDYYLKQGYTGDNDIKSFVQPQPCLWNGVEYPSQKALATALGVSESSIGAYLKSGYTSDDDVPKQKKPCVWNGIVYCSQSEAAKANNVTKWQMSEYIRRGYSGDSDIKGRVKRE